MICYTKSQDLGNEKLTECPARLSSAKNEADRCQYPLSFVYKDAKWLII